MEKRVNINEFAESLRALVKELEALRAEQGKRLFDTSPEARLLRSIKAALNFYDMER